MPGPASLLSLFSHLLWSCWPDSKWVIPCQIQLCPSLLPSLPLALFILACHSLWVILCQVQASSCVSSHFHSGPVGLIGSKWLHARCNCAPSHCPNSHCSCAVGLTDCMWWVHARSTGIPSYCFYSHLTGCMWIHARSSYVPSHSHFGSVGFTVCKWFHGRPGNCAPSHCSHFYSGPVGLTVCEWFHARFKCPFLLSLFPPCSCWLDRMWVSNLCQVQMCPFLTLVTWHSHSVLLAWQTVGDFTANPVVTPFNLLSPFPFPLWSCWSASK